MREQRRLLRVSHPVRACPNCPNLYLGKRPLCPTCMKDRHRTRTATRRANGEHDYNDEAWRAQRKRRFATSPPCVDCGAPAVDLDHVPPRRLLIAASVVNVDDDVWLHPRCKPCHSWRTATIDLPLIRRLDAGEDASTLCDEALADQRKRTSRSVAARADTLGITP